MKLDKWLNQQITVQSQDGINWQTGQPAWGVKTPVPCRIEEKIRMVRDPEGIEKQSTHKIMTTYQIGIEDRIWLPGTDTADDGQAKYPINVLGIPDKRNKIKLYTVYL